MAFARRGLATVTAAMAVALVACTASALPTLRPISTPSASAGRATLAPRPTLAPGPTLAPEPTTAPQPTAAASLAPLPQQLIGEWDVEAFQDQALTQSVRQKLRFYPDAHYDYELGQCQGAGNCGIVANEWGWAQADGRSVALQPMTASADGPRAYGYSIGRDEIGSVILILVARDGTQTTYYAGP
jgi:hypothetical protein